jgi:Flp pilus assembly protein protease CpaA
VSAEFHFRIGIALAAGKPSIALGMLAAIAIAGALLAVFIHYRYRPREASSPPMPLSASTYKNISINKFASTASTPQALPYGVAIAIGSLAVLLAQMQGAG